MTNQPEVCRRLTIRFEGRVQGVGFRMTVVMLARHHPVGGWVRNLPDGDVEMVVEGAERAIFAFLDEVRSSAVYRFVMNERVQWSAAIGDLKTLDVRYG